MTKKIDSNLIVALDVGTSKIVAIVADVLPGNKIDVIGVGSCPSKGMKKGIVVNIDSVVKSIECAVEEAELMAGCHIDSVYTGIAGSHIHSVNSHGVVAIKDREVTALDVDRVIEAAKAVAIPAEKKIIHAIAQEFIIDHQAGISSPIGMSGVRLEANVHLVTGAISAAQNIVNCIRRCGIEVEDLILEPLAASSAVLTEDEKRQGVCLVDIGGGTTDIVVYVDGAIRHTAVLPIAGDQVTNDVAIALRTSTQNAENIKLQHGCADAASMGEDYQLNVANLGANEISTISKAYLTAIIQPRYEELFALILDELKRAGVVESLAAGIILTGGSAKMQGAVSLAVEVFKMPVRIGAPVNIADLHESLQNPNFATSVGLLLHGLKKQEYLGDKLVHHAGFKEFFGRVKNWFQGNF